MMGAFTVQRFREGCSSMIEVRYIIVEETVLGFGS